MLFLSENFEDISRYYRYTYVKFKETGDRLFYISSVSSEKITGRASDETPFELYLNDEFPYEVDYVLPNKSYFQTGPTATLLHRIPAKQYRRGVSEENVSCRTLQQNGGSSKREITFSLLEAFVGKQAFTPFITALQHTSDMLSIALSPRMAYACGARTIYVDDVCIAKVMNRPKQLKCYSSVFVPELLALVAGTNYKVVV